MLKIEFVDAKDIFKNGETNKDYGNIPPYLRGYNIEVTLDDGRKKWLPCRFIRTDIDKYLNSSSMSQEMDEQFFTLTGRVCFRGYFNEVWDMRNADFVLKKVKVEEEGF